MITKTQIKQMAIFISRHEEWYKLIDSSGKVRLHISTIKFTLIDFSEFHRSEQ